MIRFLLGVAVAVACLWGYDRWSGTAATAAASDQPGPVAGPDFDLAAPAPDAAAGETPDAPGPEVVPPEAAASGFDALLTATGADRSRIAAALAGRAAATAGSAEQLVALLRPGNAFLHSEEGRLVGERALEAIRGCDPWEGLAAVGALIERCVAGPHGVTDVAARGFVDRARDVHRTLVHDTLLARTVRGMKVHRVAAGESLSKIAATHGRQLGVPLEWGTLQYLNGIRDPLGLRVGEEIRVPVDPVRVVVWKRGFLLAVYVGERMLRTAWCAHGKPGRETPVSQFEVQEKIERPDWPDPAGGLVPYGHPDNPLGTHFVKLAHPSLSGFGIHGTWAPESIGTRASLGCIRVSNDEVAVLFSLVPRGAVVEVRP